MSGEDSMTTTRRLTPRPTGRSCSSHIRFGASLEYYSPIGVCSGGVAGESQAFDRPLGKQTAVMLADGV